MIRNANVATIQAWPDTESGWRRDPKTRTQVKLGADVAFGISVIIGENTIIGNNVIIGRCATIGNNVIIGNNVKIGTNVTIGNNMKLCDHAVLFRTPILIQGSRHLIGYVGKDLVQSGCITKPLAWWIKNVEQCAENHRYTLYQQKEYRLHVENIAAWMSLWGYVDYEKDDPGCNKGKQVGIKWLQAECKRLIEAITQIRKLPRFIIGGTISGSPEKLIKAAAVDAIIEAVEVEHG